MIAVSPCAITTSSLEKVAVQPLSHSWPMEIRPCWSCGKMCACLASVGSVGKSSVAVCVASIVSPFGIRTLMPVLVGWMLLQALWYVRKWPVAPVSAMLLFSKLFRLLFAIGVKDNVWLILVVLILTRDAVCT